MHIDCGSCPVRDRHCADCMVTVLLQMPVPRADLFPAEAGGRNELGLTVTERERAALDIFVDAGMLSASQVRAARPVAEPLVGLRSTG